MHTTLNEYYSGHDVLDFKRPGLQDREFSRLRKNKIPVEAELDLHGHTVNTALSALEHFLTKGYRCVRIIHGKGKNNIATLKSHVNEWLKNSPIVLGFCSATSNTGGTGAVLVLLKNMRGDYYA